MSGRRLFQSGLAILGLAALLFLAPAAPLHAAPIPDDEVILGDDLTLHEGERVNGDLVMMGGSLTMRPGSAVEGSITAFGGRMEIDGTVEGELVAFGGDVQLGDHALVRGEVVALGGRLHRAEGARTGEVVESARFSGSRFWRSLRFPSGVLSWDRSPWSALWTGVTILALALLTALLGVAVAHFWPAQTDEVGRTIIRAPLPSLGVGCALYPLVGTLTVLMLITICLAPFIPFVALLFVASSLLGWIALSKLWGRWLARRFGWRAATPLALVGVGVFTLTVLLLILGAIPLLGPLLTLGAASIGLGAVILSRFGTTRYGDRPAQPDSHHAVQP